MAIGTPTHIIALIKKLYSDTTSCLIINNTISRPFLTKCGVKQGDPLSCLLFNLSLEPLLRAILNHKESSCQAHADDLLLLSKTVEELHSQLKYIQTYESHSNARLSRSKCPTLIKPGTTLKKAPLPTTTLPSRYLGINLHHAERYQLFQKRSTDTWKYSPDLKDSCCQMRHHPPSPPLYYTRLIISLMEQQSQGRSKQLSGALQN